MNLIGIEDSPSKQEARLARSYLIEDQISVCSGDYSEAVKEQS